MVRIVGAALPLRARVPAPYVLTFAPFTIIALWQRAGAHAHTAKNHDNNQPAMARLLCGAGTLSVLQGIEAAERLITQQVSPFWYQDYIGVEPAAQVRAPPMCALTTL